MKTYLSFLETYLFEMKTYLVVLETYLFEMKTYLSFLETYLFEMKTYLFVLETYLFEMKTYLSYLERYVLDLSTSLMLPFSSLLLLIYVSCFSFTRQITEKEIVLNVRILTFWRFIFKVANSH